MTVLMYDCLLSFWPSFPWCHHSAPAAFKSNIGCTLVLPIKTNWGHVWPIGTNCDLLGLFVTNWIYLKPFGIIWDHFGIGLNHFGTIWNHIGMFWDDFWYNLVLIFIQIEMLLRDNTKLAWSHSGCTNIDEFQCNLNGWKYVFLKWNIVLLISNLNTRVLFIF